MEAGREQVCLAVGGRFVYPHASTLAFIISSRLSLADFVVRDWIYFDFARYFYAPISTAVLSSTCFLAGGLVFVISFLGPYFILFHFALRFVFYILFPGYFARYNGCDTPCSIFFSIARLSFIFFFFSLSHPCPSNTLSQPYVINPIKVSVLSSARIAQAQGKADSSGDLLPINNCTALISFNRRLNVIQISESCHELLNPS